MKAGEPNVLKGLLILVACFVISGFGTYIFVQRFARHLRISGRREKPAYSDVGIVLGAYTNGYRPSLPLQSRLFAATHLFRQGVIHRIIVSGGQGEDETVSEARSMKRFLMMNGVPMEAIIEERMSRDTWENLKNSQSIMERHHFQTAVVITSDYHLPRALAVAETLGIHATGYAAYSTRKEFSAAVREVFAHIQYTLKGRESLF